MCLLHKKGDLMVCTNYTGVMLLYIVYIVLSDILIVFPTQSKDNRELPV